MFYESLYYSREALAEQEWWRLITASFAHLSMTHAVGNGLGLAVLAFGLGPVVRLPRLLAVLLAGAVATGLGIHFLTPLAWYAGLSGALWAVAGHGAYVIGRIAPLMGRSMLAVMALCVCLDQFRSLTWSGELLAPEAHLYGFVTGVTIAVIESRLRPAAHRSAVPSAVVSRRPSGPMASHALRVGRAGAQAASPIDPRGIG